MKPSHVKIWTGVAIVAIFTILIGIYISVSTAIRIEAKIDRISTVLDSWELQ